jgi:hypothetical protein
LRLAHTLTKGLKIVLIVDGLDEYKSDQADLVDFFKGLTSGSTVKAIVSSRPEPLFMNALQACPSLRMDLLTKDDMEFYVTSKLELHRHMRRFLSTNAGCLQDISTTAAKQSSGVFLWTALVVRLLEEMLDTGCFLHELSEAIYVYPVEISALFRHMLLRAKEGHKTERFRIFTFARIAGETERRFPSLLRFWFFLSESPGTSVGAQSEFPDKGATSQDQLDIAADRIQSRCCGLLECVTRATSKEYCDEFEGIVIPFHRTLFDFLREPEVIKMMAQQSGNFQPSSRLLESILWCLKRRWMWRTRSSEHWEALKTMLESAMVYLRRSEDQSPSPADYLQSLDAAMVEVWAAMKRNADSSRAFPDYQMPWFQLLDKVDVRSVHDLRPHHYRVWLALSYRLSRTVKDTTNVTLVEWDVGWGHVSTLMICWAVYTKVECPMDPEITFMILHLARKCNLKGPNLWERPLWEIVLLMRPLGPALTTLPRYCQEIIADCSSRFRAFNKWAHIVQAMMKAGETLQHSCPLLGHGQKSGRGEKISARENIESGITNYLLNRAGRSSTFEANGLMPCATKSSDESSDICVDVDQLHRLLESTSIDGDDCMKGSESCSDISQEKLQQHERKGKEHDNTQPVDATGCEKPLLPKHQLSPQSESTETVPTDEGPNFVQIITREVFEAVENLGSNTRTETLVTSITERQRVVVDLCSRQRRQEAGSSCLDFGLP